MTTSGAVYQPTTVTCESEHNHGPHRWSREPISYIAATVSQAACKPCGISCVPIRNVLPVVYLTSAIACFLIGLTMLIDGAIGYGEIAADASDTFYLCITISGVLLMALALLFVVLFLKITRRLCFRAGKDHLDDGGGGGGAQALTVNPSTDFLITPQYAPVSEVTYQPSQADLEQSNLISPTNKEGIANEETECMLENDPRIVLRPLNQQNLHEDT